MAWDDTFDAVHGGQQLRLFDACYDKYGFQPIVVSDGESRPVAAMLRPARRPTGAEARHLLRRLVREIRSHWPRVECMIRADSHYCAPELLDFRRAARIDFLLGVASTTTLRRHVETLEASTARRHAGAPGSEKLRRHKEFHDGAASWTRGERIIARVEASAQGTDTRFVVTNLAAGSARTIYEDLYCRRGQAENHIKAWKRHLAADRTSCCRATANQFRLMLHTGAYWLLCSLRSLMPTRDLAHRAVRHAAAAPGEARHPRRRAEDPRHAAPAERLSRQGHPAPRARTLAAPHLLSNGADAPTEPPTPQSARPAMRTT